MLIRVVYFEGKQFKELMSLENAEELAAANELTLICTDEKNKIYKIVDIGKENYRNKLKEKENKRKSKLIIKEFKFKIGIQKLDLERILNQISQYNNKNYRINIIVESRNRNTTKGEVDDFIDYIANFTNMKVTNKTVSNKHTSFQLE